MSNIDNIVSAISTKYPLLAIYVGVPYNNPPNVFPHVIIYSHTTDFQYPRQVHNIYIGVSVQNSATTIDESGTVTRYTGYSDLVSLMENIKIAILEKKGFFGLSFREEEVDSQNTHDCFSGKFTVICQDVIASQGVSNGRY